jgi:DNA-binding response OmpR family regulator
MRILVIEDDRLVADFVQALDVGAGDYLGKPFPVGELRTRIRARLARATRRASRPAASACRR